MILQSRINILLSLALFLQIFYWAASADIRAKWQGVPPVPSRTGAVMMALGDSEFSYRMLGMTLQHLGDTGGQATPLKDYDYKKIGQWLWLLYELDPASDHAPLLAAYYFGATMEAEDSAVIVDYLGKIGQNPVGEKWRWLAQAAYLARHRVRDLDLALDLAYKLSKMEPIDDILPMWARHMPASILQEQGDKEAARDIIENLLSSGKKFHPNEINFMKSYLIEQLGIDPKEVDKMSPKT